MKGFGSSNKNKNSKSFINLSKKEIVELAINYHSKGNINLAIKYYKYCVDNNICDQKVFCNYAIILRNLGKLDEAEKILRKFFSINPNSVLIHNNLSGILRELGKLNDAENILKKSLGIEPQNAKTLYNLGCLLIDLRKYKEAEIIVKESISLNLSNSDAYLNLGIIMRNLGNFNEAYYYLKKVLELKPNNALAFLNIGILYKELKKYDLAIEYLYKANKIEKELSSIKYEIINCNGLICDWNTNDQEENWKKDLGLTGDSVNPLDFFLYDDNPLNHLKRAKNFFNQHHKRKEFKILPNRNQKIRIGYFSSDFHGNHPLMSLFPSIVTSHDNFSFEVYIYSFTTKEDKYTEKLKDSADFFKDIKSFSEEESIELIRKDKLDIAIDLMGYTSKSRTYIFSNRVAPIQINFLGYPGTMGTKIYDFIISDDIIIPKDFEKFYIEKVLKLNHYFPPNTRATEQNNEKVSREEFNLPKDAFVFICFNQNKKITKKEFEIWMRLLKEINNSVLWLQKTNKFSESNLLKEAKRRKINPKRIIFASKTKSYKRHLARYSLGDLGLDTFNYNGHTTTSDALSSGLPVLTKIGKSFSARVSASILSSINLNKLIAINEKEYEEKALFLARNRLELKRIQSSLNSNIRNSSLTNHKQYTKDLENRYKELLEITI